MKRKPDVPQMQTSFPIDSQAAITWDERGDVEIIALANQYRPARDAAILTRSNDVDYDDTGVTKARRNDGAHS